MAISSVTMNSPLNDQYGIISWLSLFLVCGHPSIINFVNYCRCSSLYVTTCMFSVDICCCFHCMNTQLLHFSNFFHYFPHGFVSIASLWYKGVDVPFSGVLLTKCVVISVILLQYLSWILLPVGCGLLLHLLLWQSSSRGKFLDHIVFQGPLPLWCLSLLCTWKGFDDECYC